MAEQKEMKKHLPWIFAYQSGVGSFGTTLILGYLSFFVTEYMGMSLATLALVLSICTIGDYVCTFVTGPLVQKTNTKMGQYRPYILIMPFVIVGGYMMVFWGFRGSDVGQAILIGSMYTMTGFGWSSMTAARNGLMAKVAGSSADNRLSITSKSALAGRIGGVVVSMITAPILQRTTAGGVNGYFILTVIYGIIVIIPYMILFLTTKEYDVYDPNFKAPQSATNVKVSEMYLDTIKNTKFLAIFFAAIVSGLGMQAVSPLNTYYWRYSIGNWDLLALSQTISMGIGIAAATIMIPVSKKLGKKKSAVFSSFAGAGLNVLVAFLTDGSFVWKVVLASCASFTGAIMAAWGINLYLDVAEYQQYKTGKDQKAFVMSMSNMTARLAAVIGTPLAAFILSKCGYQVVDGVGSMESTRTLVMFIGLAPACMSTITGFIYLFFYRMTDEQAREYAEANAAAAAERAAAAAAAADAA
ncbi:MAG: MFS transporter, partial [Coriobacteriia bacterium]|nr:MFS transporter [Coriobacteriia bacterium]